jgi:hypothetical protein
MTAGSSEEFIWRLACRIDADYYHSGEESAREWLNMALLNDLDAETLANNAFLIEFLRDLESPLVVAVHSRD